MKRVHARSGCNSLLLLYFTFKYPAHSNNDAISVYISLYSQGSFIRVSKFNDENYSSVASEAAAAYGLMPTIQLKIRVHTHAHLHAHGHGPGPGHGDGHEPSGYQPYVLESLRLKLWQFAIIIIGITLHYWMFIVLTPASTLVVHIDICVSVYLCVHAYACLWQPMCFVLLHSNDEKNDCVFVSLSRSIRLPD